MFQRFSCGKTHKPFIAGKLGKDSLHLVAGHDDGQPHGFAGADYVAHISDLPTDDMTIQEQKRGERLVLRRGADFLFHGKMREESIDLRLGHFVRMPYFMKEDEPFHPVAIGLFCTAAVMACAERLSQPVQQLRSSRRIGYPFFGNG